MYDENVKNRYRSVTPPVGMKERVMTACYAAKKKRTRRQKRLVSFAACLMIVMGISVYGLSPKPVIYSGERMMENGVLPVAYEAIMVDPSTGTMHGQKMKAVEAVNAGVVAEGCIPLRFDRAAAVKVSAGEMYLFDPITGMAQQMGTSCKVEPDMQMYWQCDKEEAAVLTVRSGVRTVRLHLMQNNDRWLLRQ